MEAQQNIDNIATKQLPKGTYKESHYSAVSTGDGNCLFNSVSIALIGE